MRVVLFFIFLSLLNTSIAQSKKSTSKEVYFKLSAGYGFTSSINYYTQQVDLPGGGSVKTNLPFTYGKGFNVKGGIGYMFHPNLGFEVLASYLVGAKNRYNNVFVESNYTVHQAVAIYSRMFNIQPSLVFTSDLGKVAAYGKFGCNIGWGYAIEDIENIELYTNGSSYVGQIQWRYNGFSGLGLTSSLGLRFKGKSTIDYFIELNHLSFATAPKSASKVREDVNGKSVLSNQTVSQKEHVFVEQLDVNASQNTWQPLKVLSHKQSFTTFGFNVGLIIKMK